jgi:uncharacterized protein
VLEYSSISKINKKEIKMKNPVVWFEIYVDDLERARKFYETVFDIKLEEIHVSNTEHSMKMLAFSKNIAGDGATGTLTKIEGVKAGGNNVLLYFRSENCSIEEGRIEKAGGKVFKGKVSVGEFGYICLGFDTEGNMFGIISES